MKNFRKVLALILVVATLFSFVAMASAKSASEYTDYADVTYVEAVDVLTALGIINGYDGAYHPADTIDRDEMAKMVAVLRNAGDFDADLYASANKFADVKGQWAEGYVAYCAQLGIIAGQNATTFAPDAAVKVIEVAKMLLCTLGFDAQKQGYVGANWEVAVLRDATKFGLIPAEVNPYEAASRDVAAQMFLNALQADMVVGYVGEGLIKMTNSLYVAMADGKLADISLYEAEKNGWEILSGANAVISNVPLYSIYANLDYVPNQMDCYGRPGHSWTLKSGTKVTSIGFYADAPVKTWTNADKATVDAAWAAMTTDPQVVYVDGYGPTTATYGNGVLVEMYKNCIVVINTYIAKVANVSKYYGTFDLVNDGGHKIATFKTGDYAVKNGDMVLFWLCDGSNPVHASKNENTYLAYTRFNLGAVKLHDLKVVEAVNVDVTAGDNYIGVSDDILYTADKSYKYAANIGNAMDESASMDALVAADIAADGANYNLYFDEYGYIMYYAVPAAADTTKYAYVVEGTGYCTGNQGQVVGSVGGWDDAGCADTATLVHFGEDGALTPDKKFATNHALLEALAVRSEWDYTAWNTEKGVGMLVRYTVDANGNMVYTDGEDYANQGKYATVGAELNKGSYVIDENGVYCTSKTKFMIRTLNLDGTYSYEQVTGYENLKGSYIADEVNFNYATDKTATNIQYFTEAAHPEFASYVFIDAKYQNAEAEHFMLLGEVYYERFETALDSIFGEDYDVFDAIVDGERALIATKEDVRVAPGYMYTDILSYLGFNVTLADGTTYELYVWAQPDYAARISYVDYAYEVVDGEVYVKYVDGGVAKMAKLADGAKVFTLKAVWDATIEDYVMKVEETLVTAEELAYGYDYTVRGYIYLTDAVPAVADEIYVVTDSFYDYFF